MPPATRRVLLIDWACVLPPGWLLDDAAPTATLPARQLAEAGWDVTVLAAEVPAWAFESVRPVLVRAGLKLVRMVVGDGSDPAVRQRSDSGNQTDAVIPDTPDITDIPDDRPVKVIQLAQPLAQFDPIINRWPEGAAARRQGWQQDYAVLWGDWWGLTDPLMGWFGPWAELAWGAGFALHRARPFTAVAAAPGLQVNFLVAQQMAADLGIDLLWGDRVG